MSILSKIVQAKAQEVASRKAIYPVAYLEQCSCFATHCVSMTDYLTRKKTSGIIAEFKRQSPSAGWINQYASAGAVSLAYMQAGAAALSILTDTLFFGAQQDDLPQSRALNYCPILRKDFIIDEYQILESKAMGADAILLIAAILSPEQIRSFTQLAHSLSLQVLLEVQQEEDILPNTATPVDMLGINNRNLRDFSVDLEHSTRLAALLPDGPVKVAESGIRSPEDIHLLKQSGFTGFLIGTQFMRHSDPGAACAALIQQLAYEH